MRKRSIRVLACVIAVVALLLAAVITVKVPAQRAQADTMTTGSTGENSSDSVATGSECTPDGLPVDHHFPSGYSLEGTKVWQDDANRDGQRKSVTLEIRNADGSSTGRSTTIPVAAGASNASDSFSIDMGGLPADANESYVLTETSGVDGYTSSGDQTLSVEYTPPELVEEGGALATKWTPASTMNIPTGPADTVGWIAVKNGSDYMLWTPNEICGSTLDFRNAIASLNSDFKVGSGKSTPLVTIYGDQTFNGFAAHIDSDGTLIATLANPNNFSNVTWGHFVPGHWALATPNVTVTNTHVPETVDVQVTKQWSDGNTNHQPITVNLLANGVPASTADGTAVPAQGISAADNWSYTFAGLPKYLPGRVGEEIQYSLTEDPVEDYTTAVTGTATDTDNDGVINLTVTNARKTGSLSIAKDLPADAPQFATSSTFTGTWAWILVSKR